MSIRSSLAELQSYTAPNREVLVPPQGTLDGGEVLPGFSLSLADVFQKAGRRS